MKQNGQPLLAALLLTGLLTGLLASPASAAEVGRSQMCIMSNYIAETPVIDAHTILVRMNPGRGYRRIDLADDCSALTDGRAVAFASTGRVCVQDSLAVRQASGAACVISKIVIINAAEARALMTRNR